VTLQGLATGALGAFFIKVKTVKQDSGLSGTAVQEQKAPPSLPK